MKSLAIPKESAHSKRRLMCLRKVIGQRNVPARGRHLEHEAAGIRIRQMRGDRVEIDDTRSGKPVIVTFPVGIGQVRRDETVAPIFKQSYGRIPIQNIMRSIETQAQAR